ncbi:peroxin-20 Pex20-Penicillium chrysogenum [Penicillium paradoxum]|uniref:peroxin-20 Pex20-Penicillium chrysogenum n=1 Tax=Penicillium paradoxum TaxID=176176 RepID=UPI002549BE22|nr:peroxin-20 Pex20-Penicillium chrysogenum [Penicillium paradoxum]KAJ5787395.1 peroxin-20 Pex20-Penicillium chrysogenum [Penicillium paradoxum]
MGDALCGPSNALQNFQKHTSVDRTLQQDRLTSRQSPVQGFRSQNPQEGILDTEFAAFEGNLAGPALPNLQHPAHFGGPVHHAVAHHPAAQQAGNAGWAADFQNLQISGPSHPVAQVQRPNIAPAMAQGGWHTEFMNQNRGPMSQAQQTPQMHGAYQPSFAPGYQMYGSSMNQMQPLQAMQPQQQNHTEQFDESAFEAAFDQARADMELQGTDLAQKDTQQNLQETPEADVVEPVVQPEIRLGSDLIPQSGKQDPETRSRDADELARTAGQLLDSVRNDQTQKFQQSNFLALMRRIRDREVEVEGEDFRETAQSLHPGGRYYPGHPHTNYPGPDIPPSSKETSTLSAGPDALQS